MTTLRERAGRIPDRTASDRLIQPFELSIEPMARMLNFEIVGDPHYTGLEIQSFDDPVHGRGTVVFVSRRDDGRVDVYREPGLRLDPAGYGIAGGLGRWEEAEIDPARFDVTPIGADVEVRFTDAEGRCVEVRIDDRGGSRRHPASFLAPVGAAIQHPTSLMLVWMRRFNLLHRGGSEPEIFIDGRRATTGRLPGERLTGRRLIKCATDLGIVRLNPERAGVAPTIDADESGTVLDRRGGRAAIAVVSGWGGDHHARLELIPGLPDLARLPSAAVGGTWRLGIDEAPTVVAGTWAAERRGDRVELAMEVTRGWRPRRLPPLMRLVTRVAPVFRTWPTTYRWSAAIALSDEPTMTSSWERTGIERGESYRRLSRSS